MSESIFKQINTNNQNDALITAGQSLSYGQLAEQVKRFAQGLLVDIDNKTAKADLDEQTIAMFLPASFDYVIAMHGIWQAGGIAVPLNVHSAVSELDHYLLTAGVKTLVTSADYLTGLAPLAERLNIQLVLVEDVLSNALETATLPNVDNKRRAMMLFTSGTTNKPKGVVSTHANINAQICTLLEAWHWTDNDVIPLFLPLHHVHGIINVLSCALAAGAKVHLYPSFDVKAICEQVASNTFNVFMAVPTVYVKLLQYLDKAVDVEKSAIVAGFKQMRLNISGSAACPVKLFNQWQELTGQVLLERYGMTEIGMGISNPYEGERRAGHVGQPLPGVTLALFDENNQVIEAENTPGEIRLKSDCVFLEYWQNPNATSESFIDGWFCTGDVAVLDDGYYRIMGRASIDIIKSGGYKLSALEIEGSLLLHSDIKEVAVIGAEDETWGEKVVAFVVLNDGISLTLADLKAWCDGKMSGYKIPKQLEVVDSLPRNAMGKVTKPTLKKLI